MKISELFEKELEYIKSDILKDITVRTLDASPECFATIPASATGKYHPLYALGEAGLVRHTKAAVKIAHSIMQTKYFDNVIENLGIEACQHRFTDKQHYMDIVYSALLCHDTQKPDDTPEHKTKFEHPINATVVWLRKGTEVLDKVYPMGSEGKEIMRLECVNTVARCIAGHMGEWNVSKYSDVILHTPATSLEWFVHLCDYLASRRFLEFNFEAFEEVGR